jgi:hypothetical protein
MPTVVPPPPAFVESRALQTLPPPEPSGPTPATAAPPRISPWVAAVPGSLALIAVGGLCVYVFLQMKAPEATPLPPPPVAVAPVPPVIEKTIEEPPPPREPEPVLVPEPAPVKKTRAKKAVEPRSAETAPEPEPEPTPEPEPPPVIEEKPIVKLERPVEKPPEPPPGPKKLGAGFNLDLKLSVAKVDGGISKRRSEDALERHRDSMTACIRQSIQKLGVETSGSIDVRARIQDRGQLRAIEIKTPLPAAAACLNEALTPARLPQPDTGEATIAFTLNYRATP